MTSPPGGLQGVFDERVSSALVRLGVPSRQDLAELRALVERLLVQQTAPARSPARRRKTAVRKSAGTRTTGGRRARVE